jgi:hypothetical protein
MQYALPFGRVGELVAATVSARSSQVHAAGQSALVAHALAHMFCSGWQNIERSTPSGHAAVGAVSMTPHAASALRSSPPLFTGLHASPDDGGCVEGSTSTREVVTL